MLIHDIVYYIYVFFFSVYVCLRIMLGTYSSREWRLFFTVSFALLLLQGICLQTQGADRIWGFYPLIAHLPLLLILTIAGRARPRKAAVSIAIAYALCQLLRWLGLVIGMLRLSPALSLILHLSACHALLLILDRYVLGAIHDVLTTASQVQLQFGALPILYYVYDYFMLYTQYRYAELSILRELIPTAMVLLFLLFSVSYQRELCKGSQAEQQAAALELELQYARHEISTLRTMEERTAIYRHDLRHHLAMIDSLIAADRPQQALSYIREAESDIDTLVPTRFCGNQTVNLLLSAYRRSAQEQHVAVSVKLSLPEALPLPDTELCALLSNALENACRAAASLPEDAARCVEVFGSIRQSNLLLEIKNPYVGEVIMQDGLPLSRDENHHYGCRSIQSIVQRRRGLCTFEADNGVFVLRIAIPILNPHPSRTGRSADMH